LTKAKSRSAESRVSEFVRVSMLISRRGRKKLQRTMRNFLVFAIFAAVVAVLAPRLVDRPVARPGEPAPKAMTARPGAIPAPAQSANGRSLTVRRDSRGHFNVEGRVDGRRMDFVVDTGATIIAIPEREAARLGIHPARRDYTAQIRTANGTVHAAPTRLGMVEIGGLIVRDVSAVIMPNEALSENLLGMSFLNRLRRFEFADGKLVMEQ
jgi:aspartyl protease family protein